MYLSSLHSCIPGISDIHCSSHSGTGDILGVEWGNLKNNFSLLQAFFCPLFTLLEAEEEQVALTVTPGMWYPHQSRSWGGQWSSRRLLGTSQASHHPTLTKTHHTLFVCQKHLHLAARSCYVAPALPQSWYHLWHGLLKIISPSETEGGGLGQALVRGTKCLDPAKFKGSLPPTPSRDVAGRRMAGGHTDGKVCNNPFITLQILVLLAFAAAIFLLGNW